MADNLISFLSAKPVFLEHREAVKNLTVGFRAVFAADDCIATLRIAASSIYRVTLNGSFVAHGPARGPRGFYRIDEWDLELFLRPGNNLLAIEVAAYNIDSFYLLNQPAFLQTELISNGQVLVSTNGDGVHFSAREMTSRIQKVSRYSYQRSFIEAYRLVQGDDQWKTEVSAECPFEKPAAMEARPLIPRRIPPSDFSVRPATWQVSSGEMKRTSIPDTPWTDRCITDIGEKLDGYLQDELEILPHLELQAWAIESQRAIDKALTTDDHLKFESKGQYHIIEFGANLTGFIGMTITCQAETTLYLSFDEILIDGDIDITRVNCVNIIPLQLATGTYHFETIEPYTLRYLKLILLDGDCSSENLYLRQYANPDVWNAAFACSDRKVNTLFDAGRETFRQNAVDIFMDCPSRERAGWLCDSFFTARVAMLLSGNAVVEQNFLENFLLPESFENLPDNMIPMCYPADCYQGRFIPNYAMWFVLELEEYLARTGDHLLIEQFQPRVFALLDYFSSFLNDGGLLEKLDGWVFIEWSKANDFVQDMSFPSNMCYARMLDCISRLYSQPSLKAQADNIRTTIRKLSYDGTFFVDNMVFENDILTSTSNRTEVCQYYAFFFDIATPESHPDLWHTLMTEFGPNRDADVIYPDVFPANAFVGNFLRFELLSRYGMASQLLSESRDYLLPMVDQTRTLWEHSRASDSCNHGFASHIVNIIYRDILGVYTIDRNNKTRPLHVRLSRNNELYFLHCE